MARNPSTKVMLDAQTRHEIEALAARWRCSLAAVLRQAVAEVYRREVGTTKAAP